MVVLFIFFFKQKTAYEMRISDWSSDVCSSDLPHPAMLEAAMIEGGALPEEAVMIGDTTFDILMANDAGVRAIGVDWGYHEAHELRAAGAQAVASDPAHLERLL